MFHMEHRRLRPLAYLAFVCLIFWAAMAYTWSLWSAALAATGLGILGSWLFGSWLRDLIRSRISRKDQLARAEIQDSIDKTRARDRVLRGEV